MFTTTLGELVIHKEAEKWRSEEAMSDKLIYKKKTEEKSGQKN